MTKSKTYRYECTRDGHSKFWEYKQVGEEFIASWGKISADRPQGNKIYTYDQIQKLIREKTSEAKGYELV